MAQVDLKDIEARLTEVERENVILRNEIAELTKEARETALATGRSWSPFYEAPHAAVPVSTDGFMAKAPADWEKGDRVVRNGLSTSTIIEDINNDRTLIYVELADGEETKKMWAPSSNFYKLP